MNDSTAVEFAYQFLARGLHFREIQRFVDARSPSVDPTADTVPAPPPSRDGSIDPDTTPTPRLPTPDYVRHPETLPAPIATARIGGAGGPLLDFRGKSEEFWDEVAELVECL